MNIGLAIVASSVVILVALWGGCWLYDVVPDIYKPAAAATAAIVVVIGFAIPLMWREP